MSCVKQEESKPEKETKQNDFPTAIKWTMKENKKERKQDGEREEKDRLKHRNINGSEKKQLTETED